MVEARRGTDLYFVIDQLVNSMEFYSTERSWLKHMGKETKYSSKQLKKLYKSYYKLSPRKRFSMSFNWEKWLKKQGIVERINEINFSRTPTKKLVKIYKQMADERLSGSSVLTFRLIAKELIKRKAKLESVNEAFKIDIDKLLQNPKVRKLMTRLGVKKSQSKQGAIKILNYFANNPQALAAFKKISFESVNERKLSSHQKKAILIAIEMSGNMTGATKKIEKIKRGLSKDKKVKDALQLANESVNEGVVDDLNQILVTWEDNVYPNDKVRWNDYYHDIEQVVDKYSEKESVKEAKFSKDQIEIMKLAYGTLSGMNPNSPTYKKFIKFLDRLPKDQLKQLAGSNIKFISMLAKNRLRGESINESNASVIRKKLLKQFGDDPLYREFILAKTPKEQKKALKTLKSIRGFNAVRLMQKYVKKLQDESINEAVKDPKLKVGQKIRFKKSNRVFTLKKITHGNRGIPEDPAGTSYMFVAPGNRKEYHTKKTWAQALKKKWLQLESINEGFDKYYLSSLLDSKLKNKLEIAIKNLKGRVDGVGDDWIWFRMPSGNIRTLAQLITKLDRNKNVWIGDKRKKNIWDRRRNIDKLVEGFGGQLKGKDLEEFEKQRKENAEVLGYKATGVSDIKEITLEVKPKEKENKNEDNKD